MYLKKDGLGFHLSSIYASPNYRNCRDLWRVLDRIKASIYGAWCVGGDFNGVIYEHERRSNSMNHTLVDKDFADWVEEEEMSKIHTS